MTFAGLSRIAQTGRPHMNTATAELDPLVCAFETPEQDEHTSKISALQDALHAGLQSGEPQPFDNEAFLSRMHAQHGHGQ